MEEYYEPESLIRYLRWDAVISGHLPTTPGMKVLEKDIIHAGDQHHFARQPEAHATLALALPIYANLTRSWPTNDPCHYEFGSPMVTEDYQEIWKGQFFAMYKMETDHDGRTNLRLAVWRDGTNAPHLLVSLEVDSKTDKGRVLVGPGPLWASSSMDKWQDKRMLPLAARILHHFVRAAGPALPWSMVDQVAKHCMAMYPQKCKTLLLDAAMIGADRLLLLPAPPKELVALTVHQVARLLLQVGETANAAFVLEELAESGYPSPKLASFLWIDFAHCVVELANYQQAEAGLILALHYEVYRERDEDGEGSDDQWHHSDLYRALKPLLDVYQCLAREDNESKIVGSILAALFVKAGWEPGHDKDLKHMVRKLAAGTVLRSFLDDPALAQRTLFEVTKDSSVAYFRKTLLGCLAPLDANGAVIVPKRACEHPLCQTDQEGRYACYCGKVHYCSRDCQAGHWSMHQASCEWHGRMKLEEPQLFMWSDSSGV